MKKPLTFFLVNFHSNCNAGDAALLDVSIRIIRKTFQSPNIIIAADWPSEPQYSENGIEVIGSPVYLTGGAAKMAIPKKVGIAIYGSILGWMVAHHIMSVSSRLIPVGWQELFYAYQNADIVASVAGNIFGSTGKWGWPFPVAALAIQFAHWFQKPVYILPQSIGPLKRNWERILLRSIFSKTRIICLRESQSMRLAAQLHFPKEKTHYIPDLAFDLTAGDHIQAIKILHEYGYREDEPCIGITIINRFSYTLNVQEIADYYNNLTQAISYFIRQYQIHIFLFSQVTGPTSLEDDRRANELIYKSLGEDSQMVHIIDKALSPSMLKACYGAMDLFVASRLHSGIFAMAMGIPTVFIGYLSKTRGLLEALDLENWVIDLGEKDHGLLREKMEMAWLDRNHLAANLNLLMPNILQATRSISDLIKEDYGNIGCER